MKITKLHMERLFHQPSKSYDQHTTCTEKYLVNSFICKYDEEPLLIVVQDATNLQDIQYYFDLLESFNNKLKPPIIIVLELKINRKDNPCN